MEKRRCKQCIMPEGYPGIEFDSNGICSHCIQSNGNTKEEHVDLLGKDKLVELIRSEKKTAEFDCVVPLSGGKDSVYVLYYSVKKLGLKPLAVTYDSGYRTQMAIDNVRNACDALHVPCIVKVAKKGLQDKLLRESLRISDVLGTFVLTCLSCDTLIKVIPIQAAKQRGIPFVLFGDSLRESVKLMRLRSRSGTIRYEDVRSSTIVANMLETMSRLREAHVTPLKFMRIIPRLARYRFMTTYQLLSLGVPFKNAVFPNLQPGRTKKGPQLLHFYDYVDWDPVKDLAILERELGWKHPPNRVSRFDCSLNCFGSYSAFKNGGITGNGIISCNLIREGLMSRKEALEKEQSAIHVAVEGCHRILDEIGLDQLGLSDLKDTTEGSGQAPNETDMF